MGGGGEVEEWEIGGRVGGWRNGGGEESWKEIPLPAILSTLGFLAIN